MKNVLAFLLTLAASSHAAVGGDCTWRVTGADPYRGSDTSAIMSFAHVGKTDRVSLIGRVSMFRLGLSRPDDVVRIGRDGITGAAWLKYDPGLYDMHFGVGRTCGNVSRVTWDADQYEVADVWRMGGRWCAVRPRVCGNWSWTICDFTPDGTVVPGIAPHRVPEPGTAALVASALAAMAWIQRRRRRPCRSNA